MHELGQNSTYSIHEKYIPGRLKFLNVKGKTLKNITKQYIREYLYEIEVENYLLNKTQKIQAKK